MMMKRSPAAFFVVLLTLPLYSYADALWRGASAEVSVETAEFADKQKGGSAISGLTPSFVIDLTESAAAESPGPECPPQDRPCVAEAQKVREELGRGANK
jgi:hypothetical protein